jgi:hypothetical protein
MRKRWVKGWSPWGVQLRLKKHSSSQQIMARLAAAKQVLPKQFKSAHFLWHTHTRARALFLSCVACKCCRARLWILLLSTNMLFSVFWCMLSWTSFYCRAHTYTLSLSLSLSLSQRKHTLFAALWSHTHTHTLQGVALTQSCAWDLIRCGEQTFQLPHPSISDHEWLCQE